MYTHLKNKIMVLHWHWLENNAGLRDHEEYLLDIQDYVVCLHVAIPVWQKCLLCHHSRKIVLSMSHYSHFSLVFVKTRMSSSS